MEVGDIIRTRKLRSYFTGNEARGWAEFTIDKGERKRENQRVFVLLLLGTEPLLADEKSALDDRLMLNSLGLCGEDQLEEVLGKAETKKIIKKLVKYAKTKQEAKKCQSSTSTSTTKSTAGTTTSSNVARRCRK